MRLAAAISVALILIGGCSNSAPHTISSIPLGRVIQSIGFPSVLRNSRPYILAERSIIYTGDIITTDEQSLLHIQLDSGPTLNLGTRSQLLLINIHEREHALSLSKGSMQVDDISNRVNHFEIATTVTAIETSSGKFWIGYDSDSRGIHVVSLGTEEINVQNDDGNTVLTTPFQASSVIAGAAPQDALVWSKSRFENTLKRYTRTSR
ncbi:MAG: hypothetical protein HOC70_06200 [Gammaproteobacteria bacterium]|jgi:hypothetical protein|nr:hypothetical protein [Gammaproteobacteria bacterium]MBT4492821.1 hypothetical protein [Gammaproteobacteria bacterium]MBT7369021.1 hypothetical protein [Gammaproteobacteria bacterium]